MRASGGLRANRQPDPFPERLVLLLPQNQNRFSRKEQEKRNICRLCKSLKILFMLSSGIKKPKVQSDTASDPLASADPDPPAMNPAAEIDVELSDGEGDGPIRSRKASASAPQQRAPESSSKPSLDSGEPTSDDTLG